MEASSSSRTQEEKELEEMMAELGIAEEEFIDLVFEDEMSDAAANPRWLAIGKVHTSKEYGDFWFYKNMRSAWDLAQTVKFRSLGDNLYTMQFSYLGDRNKVMEGGPWAFRGHQVVLAVYDGFKKPSLIDLNCFKIWIQIHDLPDGYGPLVKPLVAKVGALCEDEDDHGDFAGNFYRARVTLDVRKPLKNQVSIVKKQKGQIFKVKYERLPDWCDICGMIGHLYTEHGDGVHDPKALIFKELRVAWSMRGGNRGGGRTQEAGENSAKAMSQAAVMDLDKRTMNEHRDGDLNRKRGVDASPSGQAPPKNVLTLPGPGTVPASPPPKQDLKRSKLDNSSKVVAGTNVQKNASSLPGSSKERRRN